MYQGNSLILLSLASGFFQLLVIINKVDYFSFLNYVKYNRWQIIIIIIISSSSLLNHHLYHLYNHLYHHYHVDHHNLDHHHLDCHHHLDHHPTIVKIILSYQNHFIIISSSSRIILLPCMSDLICTYWSYLANTCCLYRSGCSFLH